MSDDIKKPHSSAEEDRSLVEAFQAKQTKEVFDWLVIKYQKRVFNICYRFMGNYHDANDCAQDTFVKVYRSIKDFKFKSAFSSWLYRIAVNTCKNKLNSLPRRFNKLMVQLDVIKGPAGNDPSVEFERNEKEKAIQEAIDSLEQDHKTVVLLRDIEGLSYNQISEVTGFNAGTVKSKLARARFRLQKKLEGRI